MKKRPVLATFVSGAFATGAILGVCSQVLGGEIAEIVPSINAPQPALSINTSAPGDFLQKYQEQSYVKIADSTATHLDAVMGTPNSGRGDKTLLPGEFYTFLTMVNGFHDNEVIKNCGNVNSKSTYATVKAEIDYIGLNGMASGTLGSQLILFAVGNPNTSTSSLDCIFNSTGDQRGPYIIFSDFPLGQGEYNIHFGVVGGLGLSYPIHRGDREARPCRRGGFPRVQRNIRSSIRPC